MFLFRPSRGWNRASSRCACLWERFCSSAPHSTQRETVRVPGMLIGRGPKVFSFFGAAGFSNSFFGPAPESWYPRCRYLRSDKKRLLKTASLSAFGAFGTRVSLQSRVSDGAAENVLQCELYVEVSSEQGSYGLRATSYGQPVCSELAARSSQLSSLAHYAAALANCLSYIRVLPSVT